MTGFITLCSGQGRELPELLSWDLTHGFCSPCDCFEVSFLYSPEMLAPLAEAVMIGLENPTTHNPHPATTPLAPLSMVTFAAVMAGTIVSGTLQVNMQVFVPIFVVPL